MVASQGKREIAGFERLVNPVRHFLEIVRAVFLKGAGLSALWRQYLALTLIGGSVLVLAARRFHKTVG